MVNKSKSGCKIVHIPDKPPISPHLQPTVDVHATVVEPKLASTLVRKLNQIAPLENLRHVKRVRKQCLDGATHAALPAARERERLDLVEIAVDSFAKSGFCENHRPNCFSRWSFFR
ncbi:unnamed protein product [Ilex paraguariensis]|uniref:Uncharacterized protein n=1 Tax=Ilex paraguariensis TaxID=185542 RepID=A0ABC8S508_9AQUA